MYSFFLPFDQATSNNLLVVGDGYVDAREFVPGWKRRCPSSCSFQEASLLWWSSTWYLVEQNEFRLSLIIESHFYVNFVAIESFSFLFFSNLPFRLWHCWWTTIKLFCQSYNVFVKWTSEEKSNSWEERSVATTTPLQLSSTKMSSSWISDWKESRTMSITHCIFDLDGLLLDTESIYTDCLQKLCAPYGKDFTTETKMQMMGKSSLEISQILTRQ